MRLNKLYTYFQSAAKSNPGYAFELSVVLADQDNEDSRELLLVVCTNTLTDAKRFGYVVPERGDTFVALIFNDKTEKRLLDEGVPELDALGDSLDAIIDPAELVNYLTFNNYRNLRNSTLDKGEPVE